MKAYDVIIIGQGMVGASLAAALAPQGFRIAIVDQQSLHNFTSHNETLDGRKIALSFASQQLLQTYGVWPHLSDSATAIEKIQISAEGKFGRCQITNDDIGQTSLGQVVPATQLQHALQQTIMAYDNVEFYGETVLEKIELNNNAVTLRQKSDNASVTLFAKLIVGADGANSQSRTLLNIPIDEKDYAQSALVTSLQLEHPHHHTAYQRFSKLGTLAVLPMQQNTCGFVCTASTERIEQLLTEPEQVLLDTIQQHFGYRLGKLTAVGKCYTYPLKRIIAKQQTKHCFLLLGNAAHNISPVAAQGYNLALQDIDCLARLLEKKTDDIEKLLQDYVRLRQPLQQKTITFTDKLMAIANTEKLPYHFAGVGFAWLDILNAPKKRIAKQAAGINRQLCKHVTKEAQVIKSLK
jgi:2-octaprenyl-6-methoxyphenol hydroxylase